MSHLQYFHYEGFGETSKTERWYSQAVRVGDRIECAGQGGWERLSGDIPKDLEEEITRAFDNVQHNLRIAGGTGWDQVFLIRSYHVKMDQKQVLDIMVRKMKEFCPNHQPVWTLLGVDKLGREDMNVEIDVVAHIPN